MQDQTIPVKIKKIIQIFSTEIIPHIESFDIKEYNNNITKLNFNYYKKIYIHQNEICRSIFDNMYSIIIDINTKDIHFISVLKNNKTNLRRK